MALREGIKYRWPGATFYVGRMHAGGLVVTGPMRQQDALKRVEDIIAEGHKAAMAEETITRAAWFDILNQLYQYR